MAKVVCWLAQSAGPGVVRAGWPGSNGSVIGTNALEVLGDAPAGAVVAGPAAALVLPAAPDVTVVPGAVLAPVDELPVLQPASTPMPAADTTASATFTPVLACPPPFTGRPHPDCPMPIPLAPGHR